MNCWRGICLYLNDDGTCEQDKRNYEEPKKCDIQGNTQTTHKCRYGGVGCEMCAFYLTCEET